MKQNDHSSLEKQIVEEVDWHNEASLTEIRDLILDNKTLQNCLKLSKPFSDLSYAERKSISAKLKQNH